MDIAYAAGIFDGEGCVSLGRCRNYRFIKASVVNTCRPLLVALRDEFGGDIAARRRRGDWKQSFEWRLAGGKAISFLNAVYPWLIVKERQADTAFAWDAVRPGSRRRKASDRVEHDAAMDLISDQLHWLNRKGVHGQTGLEPIEIVILETNSCP